MLEVEAEEQIGMRKKGEAGYIENKPFGVVDFNSVEWFYHDDASWYITPMISSKVKYEGVIYEIPDNDDEPVNLGDGSIGLAKYPYYDDNLMYVVCYGITESTDERLQNILFEVNTKLDEQYLPNTVLKTTPQVLSDTDKNQALANLGIDMFANYKNLGGRFFDTPELYYKYKSLDREIAIGFSPIYFDYSGVIDENHRIILIYGIREGIITEIGLNEGIGNYGGDFEIFNISNYGKNNSGEFVILSDTYDDDYRYELSININSGVYELKHVKDI